MVPSLCQGPQWGQEDPRGDGAVVLRGGLCPRMPPRLLLLGCWCTEVFLLGNGGNWDRGKEKGKEVVWDGGGLSGRLMCPIAPRLSAPASCPHRWLCLNEQRCHLHPLSHQ